VSAAAFGQALLIGLSIAAPVGPIGLLVIQRTLQRGALAGLATGLGAALADAIYGALGAYGVATLIHALQAARTPLALGGGAFLLWLAWTTWTAAPPDRAAQPRSDARGLLGCLVGTLLLTLSNPATILSFIAVFGALAGGVAQAASPAPMVLGVALGSAAWWLLLTTLVARVRGRFTPVWRRCVNRASALLLAGFALAQGGAALAGRAS
jgi:threonine/homoserine/homoserine lactone efflux protein